MNSKKGYIGIDYFRIIATLLVIAIHTSPFMGISITSDFIVTRIIGRLAVPFFFVTSGFFLISRYAYNAEKLKIFIKKTVMIYGIAMTIYIPLNIYNGYFKMDNLLPNIIKDIIFDGTFYHLWYLGASIIGAVMAWYIIKKIGYRKSFYITFVLYIIGLFGDSYYGITKTMPVLKNVYELLFQLSDYTRNGLFFAPVFFVIGGYIADNKDKLSVGQSVVGFVLSFTLMFIEALMLRRYGLQRHDSMYIFLIPSIYFIFNVLIKFKGGCKKIVRDISLITYIIHPLVIVFIRLIAKFTGTSNLIVENNCLHYILVCCGSIVFSMIWLKVLDRFKPMKIKHNVAEDRAYVEINLNNLEHNVKILNNAMPDKCNLMAVVKAESYGHGLHVIATHLNKIGVRAFAVATIDEGIRLRKYGIVGDILILGYTSPFRANDIHKYQLTQTLIDYTHAVVLEQQGYDIKAHIKVDTGMHRLGFGVEYVDEIIDTFSMRHINITGIFTHLCSADSRDEKDIKFTYDQIDKFYRVLDELKSNGVEIPKIHIQSSYGLLNYPELECDYVRAGIAMYGVLSNSNDETVLNLDLKPVLSHKARVVLIRNVRKGETVGYGRAFKVKKDSTIAILPIGYADGFPRKLSCSNNYVLLHGKKAQIVGRICMDQLVVDVTDIPNIKIGDTAILIGRDGNEELTASMVAGNCESITNELLSRMGQRLNIVCNN